MTKRIGRIVHTALLWVERLILVIVVALALISSRLAFGPVAIDGVLPLIAGYLPVPDGVAYSIGGLGVGLADDRLRLDLIATNVKLSHNDGTSIAVLPAIRVGLSPRMLLEGRPAPTRIDLVRPVVTIHRAAGGELGFAVDGDDTADVTPTSPGPETSVTDTGSAASRPASPTGEAPLLARLLADPHDQRLAWLERIRVVGATIAYSDDRRGRRLRMRDVDIDVRRSGDVVTGAGALVIEAERAAVPVRLTALRIGPDGATFAGRISEVDPEKLAPLLPWPAGLRLTGDIDFHGEADGDLKLVGAAATITAPSLTYPIAGGDGQNARVVAASQLGASLSWPDAAGRVRLSDLRMTTGDRVLSGDGWLDLANFAAAITLNLGDGGGSLRFDADDGGRASVTLSKIVPASLVGLVPAVPELAAAAAITMPVDGTIKAAWSADGKLEPVTADLSIAQGRINAPTVFDQPVEVKTGNLKAVMDPDQRRVRLDTLSLDFGGPRMDLAGEVADSGGSVDVKARLSISAMPLDDLGRYWPKAGKPRTREWITTNLSKGMIDAFQLDVVGSAPGGHFADFNLGSLNGQLHGSNVSIQYLRGLPPVEGVSRVEGVFAGRTLTVHTTGGAVRDVAAGDGTITIINLGTPREDLDIAIPLKGSARSILEVLDLPPLGYPSRLGIEPKTVRGDAAGDLHVAFPLFESLKLDDVTIGANAKLTGVAIEGVALGRDVTDGALTLALDMKGMAVKGRAKVFGIASAIDWKEIFDPQGKDPRTRLTLKSRLDAAALTAAGIKPPDEMTGSADSEVTLTIDRQKKLDIGGRLDLGRAGLNLSMLGWRKDIGTDAEAKFSIDVPTKKGAPIPIDVAIKGDGGTLSGTVTLDGDGRFAALGGGRVVGGENDYTVDITRDGDGYKANFRGKGFDARPLMGDDGEPNKKKPGKSAGDKSKDKKADKSPPVDLSLNLDRMVFAKDRALSKVSGTLARNEERWTRIDLTATDRAGKPVVVRLLPQPGGSAHLKVTSEDLGATLQSIDYSDRMRGGKLVIDGTIGAEAKAPLAGTIVLTDYTVVNAPLLAKLLNAMSLSGLVQLMQGEGLGFSRLEGAFTQSDQKITLKSVRTAGGALGLTLDGDVDLDARTLALKGTVVPVYGINRLIGQIPVLGDLLSGGAGQGVFAATWSAKGSIDEPDVSVNPLAVLAPGFLRNLFFLD